jgi:pyochelin biosynthesis protein PchG
MMPRRPWRVLVCGSNYGRSYLPAIEKAPEEFCVAGLMSRGSERSVQLASRRNVPHFRSIQELPSDIDLACAALGRNGAESVLRLIDRGIPVLCEHPQTPAFLEDAFRRASCRDIPFHVNGHFCHLSAARSFIEEAGRLRALAEPTFLELMANERSVYGIVDILRSSLAGLEPYTFEAIGRSGPFVTLQGALRNIPVTLHVQSSGMLPDASAAYLVDQRITLGFPTGVLAQLSIAGPVVWNANYNAGMDPNKPLWSPVYEDIQLTGWSLQDQRAEANLHSMRALAAQVESGEIPPNQTAEHILEVSRCSKSIGELLAR